MQNIWNVIEVWSFKVETVDWFHISSITHFNEDSKIHPLILLSFTKSLFPWNRSLQGEVEKHSQDKETCIKWEIELKALLNKGGLEAKAELDQEMKRTHHGAMLPKETPKTRKPKRKGPSSSQSSSSHAKRKHSRRGRDDKSKERRGYKGQAIQLKPRFVGDWFVKIVI